MMIKLCIATYSILAFSLATAATHHPQAFLDSITGHRDEGPQIVTHFCSTCHDLEPQIPIGAPRLGVEADWCARIRQGIDALLDHTEEGFNAMPPRGGCFECTDKQLRLAIEAMLPKQCPPLPTPKH